MGDIKDFDYFLERLELARWINETPGKRDAMFGCPVHGGSDSLHVTEMNGRGLVNCFAEKCPYEDIIEAIESPSEEEPEAEPPSVTITRRRGRVDRAKSSDGESTGKTNGQRGVRLPAASTKDPKTWLLERCGITPDFQQIFDEKVAPHLSYTADAVVFEFSNGTQKIRGVGEGKAGKSFSWRRGENAPALWPMPEDPTVEIVITEGEMDAIILRLSGYDAYSVTKGSQGSVPGVVWEALKAAGVDRVRIVFDLDDAGRKGRDIAVAGAREAGLLAVPARPVGIDVLAGEKDVRDVARPHGPEESTGLPVRLQDDSDEDEAVLLLTQKFPEREPLWLDRIHPHEHTILYGAGGTGKGVIAAWWIARLTREEGLSVLVVDYEQHAMYEWGPRLAQFGADPAKVAYVQPTKPIWDRVGFLRAQIARFNVDLVVVDSALYACGGEEAEKSVTAVKYGIAIAQLERPILTLGHVTKENADPQYPFGSVYWHNGARVTIAVSRKDDADAESARIIRNAKTNQRGMFKTVGANWEWLSNPGVGCDCRRGKAWWTHGTHLHDDEPAYSHVKQVIIDLHAQLGRPPTPEEVEEESGGKFTTTVRAITVALSKGRRSGTVLPIRKVKRAAARERP